MPLLQVVSDLHLEFCRDGGASLLMAHQWPQADALVAAGDIGMSYNAWTLSTAFEFWSERYPRIFYVPGNHEFYKDSVEPALKTIREVAAKYPKVVLLEPGVISNVGSLRVIGGTMWFPRLPDNEVYARELNDFALIKRFVPWVYEENQRHVEWLSQTLQAGDIVVTHHLPSNKSVAPQFEDSPLNRFFVCDVEHLIVKHQPYLWIHGHTHATMDYKIGSTRVVANPRGYPTSVVPENRSYKQSCLIQV